MPQVHGRTGAAHYLPYSGRVTAGPQGVRLKAPTLGTCKPCPNLNQTGHLQAQWVREAQDQTPAEKRASMTWAKRLKRIQY